MPAIYIYPLKSRQAVNEKFSYTLNPEKTLNGNLVSFINCSSDFAMDEFDTVKTSHHKSNAVRQGYHITQSYHELDPVTARQVHEMGVQTVKTHFPDFQVIVSTHLNTPHLHNHFLVNAVNVDGKMYLHQNATTEELKSTSDEIARKYNCVIIDKDYERRLKFRFSKPERNWKSEYIQAIQQAMTRTLSIKELLRYLARLGYILNIKKFTMKDPEAKQARSIAKLGPEYSQTNLSDFFRDKCINNIPNTLYYNEVKDSLPKPGDYEKQPVLRNAASTLSNEMKGITDTSRQLFQDKKYPAYYNTRYETLQEIERLEKIFVEMNQAKIYQPGDLQNKIAEYTDSVKLLQQELQKQKQKWEEYKAERIAIMDFTDVYHVWKEVQECIRKHETFKLEDPEFEKYKKGEQLRKELSHLSETEILQRYVAMITLDASIQELSQDLETHQKILKDYTDFQNLADSRPPRLCHIQFSKENIMETDEENSRLFVQIPDTPFCMHINDLACRWNANHSLAVCYFVDDIKYSLYNSAGKFMTGLSGAELNRNMESWRSLQQEKQEKQRQEENAKTQVQNLQQSKQNHAPAKDSSQKPDEPAKKKEKEITKEKAWIPELSL